MKGDVYVLAQLQPAPPPEAVTRHSVGPAGTINRTRRSPLDFGEKSAIYFAKPVMGGIGELNVE